MLKTLKMFHICLYVRKQNKTNADSIVEKYYNSFLVLFRSFQQEDFYKHVSYRIVLCHIKTLILKQDSDYYRGIILQFYTL